MTVSVLKSIWMYLAFPSPLNWSPSKLRRASHRVQLRDLATSSFVFCSNWKFAAYFHQIEEAELLLCLLSTEGSLWTQSPRYILLLESICACGMTDQHSPYDYPLSGGTRYCSRDTSSQCPNAVRLCLSNALQAKSSVSCSWTMDHCDISR